MSGAPARRRALGRGLDALIVSTLPATPTDAVDEKVGNEAGVLQLPLERIRPNPKQPRSHMEETGLAELAASIRVHGILQPLLVTSEPGDTGNYWLVAGERRWRAAQLAGLTTAPAILRETTPQQLLELALIENIQRADLNPLEEASAFAALMGEFGLTQAEVAERVGVSRPAVANAVRLLGLSARAQQALLDGRISAGHGRALLALPDTTAMDAALETVLARDMTVRQTEALVKKLLAAPAQPAPPPPADPALHAQLMRMENRFRSLLGTRVALNRNPDGSGRLTVHFYSDADLEAIYRLIAGDKDEE